VWALATGSSYVNGGTAGGSDRCVKVEAAESVRFKFAQIALIWASGEGPWGFTRVTRRPSPLVSLEEEIKIELEVAEAKKNEI
jgi:hypothetical protein